MSESSLSQAIAAYIQSRAEARLEKLEKEAEKQRKTLANSPAELAEFERQQTEKRQEESQKFQPANWLDDAARRAKQISMVTHALKYTHTDAKGSSVLSTAYQREGTGYDLLTTASLTSPSMDVVGNAAALDVAGLLLLEDEKQQLMANYLAQNDASPFAEFADDNDQLQTWLDGFKAALTGSVLSSHKLAKQIYFPVADNQYHLLSPLFASSLAQALHNRVNHYRFSDEAKDARKARREGKYYAQPTCDFPETAVQNFGGTKPQNVSQLNTSRRGKAYLFHCSPPHWQSQPSPPSSSYAFWRGYSRLAYRTARRLADYLEKVLQRDSSLPIRTQRAAMVDELVDFLVQYAAAIQRQKNWAGWSDSAALEPAEKLWLDPHNPASDFQKAREQGDWQRPVAEKFGQWLNRNLRKKKLAVKDVEFNAWTQELEQKLLQLQRDLGV